uniref:OVOS protein n=1 Tax=Dromaius novaehollandiae TaxID=8790 RepID=A0A8C4JI23_DRONO
MKRCYSPEVGLFMIHLTLSISLKNYGHQRTSICLICQLYYGNFVSLQVPPATSDPLAFITFSAKGTTVNLAERRSVAIKNVDNTVFIQTDKPIYKPGQKGGFSISLSPTLQDPEQNQIFQWLEVASKHGIVHLSFPLIQEPILGSYHIIVEKSSGEKEYHSFTVEEYVLPKFEVITSVPKRISFFDEELRVNVCALYTYGQPVQGNVQISVCQRHFYSARCEQNQKEIFFFPCLISVSSPSYWVCLTGIHMKDSDYVPVVQENDRVMFKNMDRYYKRGIPYFGQVTVTNVDGMPIANRIVLLELNDEYIANYTTDKNGTAAFSIDTSNFFDPSFKLRVSNCRTHHLPSLYSPHALFSVRRFYSRTNSFVRIEPVQEKLSCGQQRMINVLYVLNEEGYGNAMRTNFYYVVSTFSIPLTVTEKLAPSARLLLYTVHPHGEIVADSSWIRSDICFKNKVKMLKEGLPGSNVSLHLEAAANSYCALRAVDKNILLLQPEREFSPETVSHIPSPVDFYGYYYNGLNLEDGKPEQCTPIKTTFFDGLYYEPVNVSHDGDVYRIFRVCALGGPVNSVRKFFPETWIWDLVHTDSNGEANAFFTIPDTITEWKASAFCLQDDAGFGMSSTVSLTAFQPFFVDLTLPYSIIRGEKFDLIANVFNYLDKCIQVPQVPLYCLYGLPMSQSSQNSSCFLHNEGLEQRVLVMWYITPYIFHSTGDILGTALRNMENLLHMPYGCGEQNMALFTPNIYALDYLNKTGQLTEEIRAKENVFFLVFSGYQKQLSYKHQDGSYSSFGKRDREGSIWLTAFVYKSFAQAKRYIYIDNTIQSQTLIWLASKQKSGGCFESAGSHFNNAFKNGMNCLETAFNKRVHNIYTQALLAYAYGLADKEKRQKFFLEKLDKTATRVVHWERENKPPAEHFPVFYSRAPSAEIEMTSYVLLALLNKTKLTPEELSYAYSIVHWLVKQQNPYGGFSSSQVTIGDGLFLQELAASLLSKSLNTIKASFMQLPSKVFQVNDKNRFLLQQASLPTIPGHYSVEVNGTGCSFSLFSYTGNRNVSNMAIIDVKMLSGFVPIRSSLKKVKNGSKAFQKEINFSFSVEQSLPVSDIRAASVHIYDYYETGG